MKAMFAEISAPRSVVFESGSIFRQTGECSFSETDLHKLILPSSVEVGAAFCFYDCGSLEWLAFERTPNGSELRSSLSPFRLSRK
jgi:hypothetical protein